MKSSPDLPPVVARLEQLERQHRILRQVGIAAMLLVACLVVAGQAPAPNRTVEAREFILKDAGGKVRGRFYMSDSATPTLELLNENGAARVELQGGPGSLGNALMLFNSDGTVGASLFTEAEPARSGLALQAPGRRARGEFYAEAPTPDIVLYKSFNPKEGGKVIWRAP